MIVYHGSNMEVATPFVHLGRKNLDFGKGFYVTTLQEQAKRWAETIVRLRPRGTAIINKYELDYEGHPIKCSRYPYALVCLGSHARR